MPHLFRVLILILVTLSMASCATSKKSAIKYRTNRNYSKRIPTKNASLRDEIIINAAKYAGTPYKYGGKNPSKGLDCSGFVSLIYSNSGLNASGASYQQAKLGTYVSFSELQPGDLVFFGSGDRVTHVALVYSTINNRTKVIHSTKSRGVVIDDITNSRYWRKKYIFSKDIISLIEQPDIAQSGN